MDILHRLADSLDAAAGRLSAAGQRAARTELPAAAFGIDAPGRLADLGSALRDQWLRATELRGQEATGAAVRLADLADAVRTAATEYADVDAEAARAAAIRAGVEAARAAHQRSAPGA